MKLNNFLYKLMRHYAHLFPDEFYIKHQFKHILGYYPDLQNPKTFQEKLQWLKLHDRKPIYSQMVDKYEAKEFIAAKVGAEYVVPTLGIYDDVVQIDFGQLPDKFVIKTTHDSGSVIVCTDKSKLDYEKVKSEITASLHRKYYYAEREWPYINVKPRVIVEKFLESDKDDIWDYKFFCFNGEPKMMFIVSNRFKEGGHKADFYDMDGNHLDLCQLGYENNPVTPKLPDCFEKMKELAAILSKDIPHLRVDLYYENNHIYVGELTFTDSGGYVPFIPSEYNNIIGDYLTLPIHEDSK